MRQFVCFCLQSVGLFVRKAQRKLAKSTIFYMFLPAYSNFDVIQLWSCVVCHTARLSYISVSYCHPFIFCYVVSLSVSLPINITDMNANVCKCFLLKRLYMRRKRKNKNVLQRVPCTLRRSRVFIEKSSSNCFHLAKSSANDIL